MEKLTYRNIEDPRNTQFIDLRNQLAFQKGHLKNSLNLNVKNYEKYGDNFLQKNQPIVLIIDNDSTQLLDEFKDQFSMDDVLGYIMIEDIDDENKDTIETIPPQDFLDNNGDYILLDVRHPDEITRPAPEKNLVNIPLEELNTHLEDLDQSKDIYTLCGSGNRATTTASYLASQNFKPIVIKDGMKGVEDFRKKLSQ